METVDALVVGAGVVGLAVARALALAGREVIVLEANSCIGAETSSRNSEVIHAGIYYAANSRMARACVAGRTALYAYCRERNVPFSACGKLIVATTDGEAGKLAEIKARAAANGVDDLRAISAAEACALEPALACTAALLSPSTGIIDSHAFMLALQGDAEAAGAFIAFQSPFRAARAHAAGIDVDVGGAEPMRLRCRTLVNSAGLQAASVAGTIEGLAAAFVPRMYYAKGNYFVLSGRSPFSRLIYPVPVPGGLGTHLTIDLAGQTRFGPDVEWIDTPDYTVDGARAASFYGAIRRYWPDLQDNALQPGYAGIRPKLTPPGESQDFVIQDERDHGVPGLVNLFGIESPGLTAALALAAEVQQRC